MSLFVILEVDDGFTVAEVPQDKTPEVVAREAGAILVNEATYDSFEKAHDALMTMPSPYERDED